MTESVSIEQKLLETKLRRLRTQIESLNDDSFPYPDSEHALAQLEALTTKLLGQIASFQTYPLAVRRGLALRVRYILESYSELLGIVARSSATRNPFELYDPFKTLCQKILGTEVHLILSSEWNYIPFTYPMNIQELPEFIVIGMPATETENVLIFPAAAHELGHSIWLARNLNEHFSPLIMERITSAFDNREISLPTIFSDYAEIDFETDLIGRDLKNGLINDILTIGKSNLEELFCDFVGVALFGRSYLLAFDYLVAPGGGTIRSADYPETKRRSQIMNDYAEELGWAIENFADRFSSDKNIGNSYLEKVLLISDRIVESLHSEAFSLANKTVKTSWAMLPTHEGAKQAEGFFTQSFPAGAPLALGDLLNAAWGTYILRCEVSDTVELVDEITDLVLKSAEVAEFKNLCGEDA